MREVRLRQLLMLWSLISMTEPKIAALDAAKIWQLFNLGGTVLVSAEHDGKTDMMPASWASPLDYDKVLVVVDKSHYTRKLMDQSEYFALGVASAGILPELLSLGSVSKNADPEKLEKKRDGALHAARLQDSARPRLLGLGHFQETPRNGRTFKEVRPLPRAGRCRLGR